MRHSTPALICEAYLSIFLGLPSLPFPISLLKLTAVRSDFLHNPRELQRAALPLLLCSGTRLLLLFKFVPKKSPPKKKTRQRRAYTFLFTSNLFLCAISINYFPHNYVIQQAMPHAIPQTHSAFYPRRLTYGLSIYGAVNACHYNPLIRICPNKFFSLPGELISCS